MRAVVVALLGVVLLSMPASLVVGDPRGDGMPMAIPGDMMLGTASSAYQIEGGWNEGGKGASSVDSAYADRADGGGQVACDSYHKYKEDVALLKLLGATHYRFSIAWTRLLPTGEADNVNPDGVRYYNALLDELEANGIEPVVTLWHVDVPLGLEQKFGGWCGEQIVDYFEKYATVAFNEFGKRVRTWITVNEPRLFCVYGGGHGRLGATKVEPGVCEYRCAHHMLLAHARAYRAYHQRFADQGGRIGVALDNFYTKPCTTSFDDVLAAERHQQFEVGWFLEPILGSGHYPAVMRQRVGARLPKFTTDQREMIRGSLDFIGLNSYFGWSACNGIPKNANNPSFERDQNVIIPEAKDQNLPPLDFQWSPWSIRASLLWIRDRYNVENEIPFIITENGYGDSSESLHDTTRMAFFSAWMREVLRAIREDNVRVIGYFIWSLLDDFEWGAGYESKMGLVHVDFNSENRTRTPRDSLHFMKAAFASRSMPDYQPPSSSSPPSARRHSVLFFCFIVLCIASS